MPTYSYVCEACGHKFNHLQTMLSDVLKTCPICHEDKLKRLIGAGGGLIFKGSGFYITDYGRNSDNGTKESDRSKVSESPSENDKADAKKADSPGKSKAKAKSTNNK